MSYNLALLVSDFSFHITELSSHEEITKGFVERYQTIIAGSFAIVAAVIAYLAATRKLRKEEMDELERIENNSKILSIEIKIFINMMYQIKAAFEDNSVVKFTPLSAPTHYPNVLSDISKFHGELSSMVTLFFYNLSSLCTSLEDRNKTLEGYQVEIIRLNGLIHDAKSVGNMPLQSEIVGTLNATTVQRESVISIVNSKIIKQSEKMKEDATYLIPWLENYLTKSAGLTLAEAMKKYNENKVA